MFDNQIIIVFFGGGAYSVQFGRGENNMNGEIVRDTEGQEG